jgi:hypothetical protein
MIGDLMLFARPPRPDPKSLDLVEVVDDVLRALSDVIRSKSLTVERLGERSTAIWADPVQLKVVISNLLHNSVNASEMCGSIVIECRLLADANSRKLNVFSIHDRGCGLSPLDREHLFDPFYSGRQAGRGLGFGLPKCWRIVEQHSGRIEFESSAEAGTTFRVYWPANDNCV